MRMHHHSIVPLSDALRKLLALFPSRENSALNFAEFHAIWFGFMQVSLTQVQGVASLRQWL